MLRQRSSARAFYGVLSERLAAYLEDPDALVEAALQTDAIIERHKVRDWQHNQDAQNRMLNDIDDLFHELGRAHGVALPYDVLDEVVGKVMNVARVAG